MTLSTKKNIFMRAQILMLCFEQKTKFIKKQSHISPKLHNTEITHKLCKRGWYYVSVNYSQQFIHTFGRALCE